MPELSETRLATLLEPYLDGAGVPPSLFAQLSVYLDLLLRWNGRTNLTSIRDPERMVQRHFGESLFAGVQITKLFPEAETLLDVGSGAGFPGLPIQLLLPELAVTVAESQNKKASFLREVVRTLGLKTEVWGERAEGLENGRRFSVVTLRAVDKMEEAVPAARARVADGGLLVSFSTAGEAGATCTPLPGPSVGFVTLLKI